MRNTLEECLAALDGGNHGFAFASGLGAITSIVAMLSKGDHIVAMDELYGGTSLLFRLTNTFFSTIINIKLKLKHLIYWNYRNVISRLGIDVTFADITDLGVLCNALQDNTKVMLTTQRVR